MEEKKPKPRQNLMDLRFRRLEVKSLKEAIEEAETRITRISPILSDSRINLLRSHSSTYYV